MTIEQFLYQNITRLQQAGIITARLDCLVLLEDALNKDRAHLLAHPEIVLNLELEQQLNEWIKRRTECEPLAYIRQRTEFYGREFYINHRVLEPRPESETIIQLLKGLVREASGKTARESLPIQDKTVIDIGTGSGALAITSKLELPSATVIATDIDEACLEVASHNAGLLQTDIQLLRGNLLEPLQTSDLHQAILLCNLPYVPDDFHINPAALREPHVAIFGGADGLDIYRELFDQLRALTGQPAHILTESMPPQHQALAAIATVSGFMLERTDDFIQVFRKGSGNSEW